jgi:hypothetical protein
MARFLLVFAFRQLGQPVNLALVTQKPCQPVSIRDVNNLRVTGLTGCWKVARGRWGLPWRNARQTIGERDYGKLLLQRAAQMPRTSSLEERTRPGTQTGQAKHKQKQ